MGCDPISVVRDLEHYATTNDEAAPDDKGAPGVGVLCIRLGSCGVVPRSREFNHVVLAVTAKAKDVSFDWVEAKSYADMLRCERFVYGIVTPCSQVTVWPRDKDGHSPIAKADAVLVKSALMAGLRVFFTCASSQQIDQLMARRGEFRQDLQRHVQLLAKGPLNDPGQVRK